MIFVLELFSGECTICGNSSYPSGERSLAARGGERRLFFKATFISPKKWEGGNPGGGVLLGLLFAGYVPVASQNPYPIIVYSVAIL